MKWLWESVAVLGYMLCRNEMCMVYLLRTVIYVHTGSQIAWS